MDPSNGGLGRFCTRLVGRERAPQFSTEILLAVRNTNNDNPIGAPQDRLWTEDDVALFFVFQSVVEHIKRRPDLPSPLPF